MSRPAYSPKGSGVISVFEPPLVQARDPSVLDVGYDVGQDWINSTLNRYWKLTSYSSGNANWELVGGQGGSAITPFVVATDGTGDYTTIQAAITAAGAGPAAIWIRPGNYTENLSFTTNSNISLVGAVANSDVANHVTITGIHNAPTAGSLISRNIRFVSATHVFSTTAAGNSTLEVDTCQFVLTNGAIFNVANWAGTLTIRDCRDASTLNSVIDNNGGSAAVNILNSTVGVGTTTMKLVGVTNIYNSTLDTAIDFQTGSVFIARFNSFTRTMTFSGDAQGRMQHIVFKTDATAAMVMSSSGNIAVADVYISSSNNPVVDGAGVGTFSRGCMEFAIGSNIAATVSQANITAGFGRLRTRGDITCTGNGTGSDQVVEVINSDNTNPASRAIVKSTIGGTSSGDAIFQAIITGGDTVTFGLDNSTAADDFVISRSTDLGTSNLASWNGSSSELTIPAAMTITNGNLILGNAGAGVELQAGPRLLAGSGDPATVVSAAQGSLFLRTDGSSTSTRAYINTDGATAWTAVTTAT